MNSFLCRGNRTRTCAPFYFNMAQFPKLVGNQLPVTPRGGPFYYLYSAQGPYILFILKFLGVLSGRRDSNSHNLILAPDQAGHQLPATPWKFVGKGRLELPPTTRSFNPELYQLELLSHVRVSPHLSQRLYNEASCRKVLVKTTSRARWDLHPRINGFADHAISLLWYLPKY